MSDQSLRKILRMLEVPPPDPTASERALNRAIIALRNRGTPRETAHPSSLKKWRWLAATGCAAIVVLVGLWDGSREPTLAAQGHLLRQMESLFPGQLVAIIERDGDVSLILTEQPGRISDQAVLVTLHRLGSTVHVVSYSGRKVCLNVGGNQVCFEVLMTDDGKVILAGNDFLWSDNHRVRVGGFRVQAASLKQSS